jgi:hypothetical protein
MEEKKDTRKKNKDSRKCEFHKSPWHHTAYCLSKKMLVYEVKASELDPGYDSDSEPERGRMIIDTEPDATISTTKLQPYEPDEPEEGKHLFNS